MNVKICVKGKKQEHNRFGINWCKSKARYTDVGKKTILVCDLHVEKGKKIMSFFLTFVEFWLLR